MQQFPRVKLPPRIVKDPETGEERVLVEKDEDNGPGLPAFWQAILKNYSRPGKHKGGHAGEREKTVARRRSRNRREKASRRANRP